MGDFGDIQRAAREGRIIVDHPEIRGDALHNMIVWFEPTAEEVVYAIENAVDVWPTNYHGHTAWAVKSFDLDDEPITLAVTLDAQGNVLILGMVP
jgi:hypothetical protein